LYDDLKWAQAVCSATSSLLLDWQETGRALFWVQAELRNISGVNELVEDGIGIHLSITNCVEQIKKSFPQLI
jgi:hypothetical protein